jgi:hypothetical protein
MNNLRLYHKIFRQLSQWMPGERITRVRNGALLVVGLYLGKAVHMAHIVREWPLPGKELSLVNRLQRFLDNDRVEVVNWYRPVIKPILNRLAGQPIRLVMDVTKVGLGHRMTMIGLAYRRRTLPIAWKVVKGPKGHVGYQTTIQLLGEIRQWLPPHSPVELVADAGYESLHLLRWLSRQHWHFVVRLAGRTQVSKNGKDWAKLNQYPLKEGQTQVVGWVRLTTQHNFGWLYLVMHWDNGEDEPWYLISNHALPSHTLIRQYARRMWIEEMFGDMKGHGFDIEATHLRDARRITRLILGVCIAYIWLISVGSWVVKNGLRHFIDVKSRRDKSYFRLGWDWLARCLRLNQPFPIRFIPYYL